MVQKLIVATFHLKQTLLVNALSVFVLLNLCTLAGHVLHSNRQVGHVLTMDQIHLLLATELLMRLTKLKFF